MWKWSQLYHEIIEGISSVCSANGSPLVLLSAPLLVCQSDPTEAPLFASSSIQKKELRPLLAAAPRGCGGFILDHLWSEEALAASSFPGDPLLYRQDRVARQSPAESRPSVAQRKIEKETVGGNPGRRPRASIFGKPLRG